MERSVPHGDVAAAHVMVSRLDPACAERDVTYALMMSRAVRPGPKLATARSWVGLGELCRLCAGRPTQVRPADRVEPAPGRADEPRCRGARFTW